MSTRRDPSIPARRGRNEFEANRRYRQVLENKLIGQHGLTSEQAEASVKSSHSWLYEQRLKSKSPGAQSEA
jgi:hypothetical protein